MVINHITSLHYPLPVAVSRKAHSVLSSQSQRQLFLTLEWQQLCKGGGREKERERERDA